MATFVLIHGSWHGGWCFDEVKALLEAEGHAVLAPDLPGMGGTEAQLAAVTLRGWAEFTVGLCRNASQQPVVLAGHSRGGLVISEAAERDPGAMQALVYICAMMLPAGMSRAEFKALEEPNPAFDGLVICYRRRPRAPKSSAPIRAQFLRSFPRRTRLPRRWRGCWPSRTGRVRQELTVTPERWGSLPRTYIECIAGPHHPAVQPALDAAIVTRRESGVARRRSFARSSRVRRNWQRR